MLGVGEGVPRHQVSLKRSELARNTGDTVFDDCRLCFAPLCVTTTLPLIRPCFQ